MNKYALVMHKSTKALNFISDIYDEVSAYNRGALFGGKSYSELELKEMEEYKGLLSVKSNIESKYPNYINNPISLWKMARGKQSAFRINGRTYFYK